METRATKAPRENLDALETLGLLVPRVLRAWLVTRDQLGS